ADARHLPRRAAVHDHRLRAPRHPGRLPDPVALAAELHEMKSKAHFIERVSREMDEDLPFLEGSTPGLLAACCLILGKENHESGLAGQVTARADDPGTFWT